jgi:hypothetical protein
MRVNWGRRTPRSFAGDASQSWLIMKNGAHVIGLFQGLFEKNILNLQPRVGQ